MKRVISVFLAVAAIIALASCAAKLPDISAYGDTPIEISGLLDEDFTITPNELAKFPLTHLSANGVTAQSGKVDKASDVGVTLVDFLAHYGKSPADFKYIRFYAYDKYQITLGGAKYTDDVVLFALASHGKPLDEALQPMRLIIPTAETNQWIYGIVRIEFVAQG
ncbi:MAG: molybdopterin-dependent oxidoreductase [Oscillospiraceae bacterium]|nr:molybdopterin-dependent oxidoreductase [Oscillospiraceae bacterium]